MQSIGHDMSTQHHQSHACMPAYAALAEALRWYLESPRKSLRGSCGSPSIVPSRSDAPKSSAPSQHHSVDPTSIRRHNNRKSLRGSCGSPSIVPSRSDAPEILSTIATSLRRPNINPSTQHHQSPRKGTIENFLCKRPPSPSPIPAPYFIPAPCFIPAPYFIPATLPKSSASSP